MSFTTLKKELDNYKFRNLYIFTGEEKEVLNKYIKRVANGNPIIKTTSFVDIMSRLTSNTLFSTPYTYVVENDKSIKDLEVSTILKLVGTNKVIFVFNEIDKRIKFFKQVKDYIIEFNKFNENQLAGLIQSKLNISPQLATVLSTYCNNDVARVEQEVYKLSYFPQELTWELLNELVTPVPEDRIFDMVQSIATNNPEQVYDIYQDLLELKVSPIKIISIMYTTFKNVFIVQSQKQYDNKEIAKKTGLTPFQVLKARELTGTYTLEQLLTILKQVQETEVKVKTGKVDMELGFNTLLLNIFK